MEHPEGNNIAIVPEQFTMQTQKEIVTLHPNQLGSMNIDIVSFQRLAYRIFEELGVEHLEVLDDMGKSMVLRRGGSRAEENLGLYGSHLNQTGFVEPAKIYAFELYHSTGYRPENLREAMEHAGPLLCEKLHDISVVYEAFQQEIQEKYITAEEIPGCAVPGAAKIGADQEKCGGRWMAIQVSYTGPVPDRGIADALCETGGSLRL